MTTVTEAPSKTEQLADRATRARKLAGAAIRKAAKVAADPEVERSTRARQALKVKAEALDEIALVLAGKD